MADKPSHRFSDRIEFLATKLVDERGKLYVRIEVPVKENGFRNNFFVHFRKKGTVQWQSSPLIRNSNLIDMHGLDMESVYELRVAVLSLTKELFTNIEPNTRREDVGEIIDEEEEEINTSNKGKSSSKNSLDIREVEKFAINLVGQVVNDALHIVNTRSEQNI